MRPPPRRLAPSRAATPLMVHVRLPRRNTTPDESLPPATHVVRPISAKRQRPSSESSASGSEDVQTDDTSEGPLNPRTQTNKAVSGSVKPRREAYSTLKKREKDALMKEAQVLEAQADMLRARAGMASVRAQDGIHQVQQQNRVLRDTRRAQLLGLCGMRSVISKQLRSEFCAPLNLPIRLGSDPLDRRATLLSLRRAKLDAADRYLSERFRGAEWGEQLKECEFWTSPEGDFCAASCDAMLFRGVQSVKQVYDALQFYMVNMEISISEVLGQLTLREDIDSIDTSISNHRLISSTSHGLVMEVNVASFGEYHETSGDHGDHEFAVFTADFVEHDELYPYCPQERVRKNITGAVSLHPLRQGPRDELVVVMRRAAFLSIQKPQFPVSDAALADLEENLSAWGDVMFKSVRATLYGE